MISMSVAHNGSLPEDPSYSIDPEALARAALAFRATPKHTEAPASINTHPTIDGYVCQLTLRDTDETRLLSRLHAILVQFPLTPPPPADPAPTPAHAPQPPLEERPDWCGIHGTAMARQSNAHGHWYSHKTADGWCNGKRRKASA
jgi:hypothetical protein